MSDPFSNPEVGEAIATLVELYGERIFIGDELFAVDSTGGFATNQRFIQAFLSADPDANEIGWPARLNTLVWAASCALRVPGDFVECGVFKGFMSRVVCRMLEFEKQDRLFRLYDTFEGLAEQRSEESERLKLNPYYKKARAEGYSAEAVRQKFANYPNVRVIAGTVPDVFLGNNCPERIAYLHIDMNAAAAEIAALEALFDKVSPGGLIVFDDYGRIAFSAMHDAERRWMAERGHPILELPTGQGLVVKR